MILLLVFLVVLVFFPKFFAYIRIAWNDKSATFSCLRSCFFFFYGRDRQEGVFKAMKKDYIFGIFTRFGLFPNFFAQVKE